MTTSPPPRNPRLAYAFLAFLFTVLVALLLSAAAEAACDPDFLPWCLAENRADYRSARDECYADYYDERSYCYDTLDPTPEQKQCRREARQGRGLCLGVVRYEREDDDRWCAAQCARMCAPTVCGR